MSGDVGASGGASRALVTIARPILSLVPHQGSPQGRAPREEGCKPRVKKVKDPNAADEDKPKCGRKRKEAPANGGSYSHALQYNGQWDHHGGGYPGYPPPPRWDDSSNGRLSERLGGFAHACAARFSLKCGVLISTLCPGIRSPKDAETEHRVIIE
ncbi:hypothetical protein C8R44DRAFT_735422 [Mycena epipterygia]|nr:hypothetical protein C8R44DRAFT_735422 [Mycena epipterygia]